MRGLDDGCIAVLSYASRLAGAAAAARAARVSLFSRGGAPVLAAIGLDLWTLTFWEIMVLSIEPPKK